MIRAMRTPSLQSLHLGHVLDIFSRGQWPVQTEALIEQVFGKNEQRGALVISGANGVVGAGKIMQLASRLAPYQVPIVALDLPQAPDGIGKQYADLVKAFGHKKAAQFMSHVVQLSYDGTQLPPQLQRYRPRFLLEAIPEILPLKKAHYDMFRAAFPNIEIRSVTSGFPRSALGVGIAHPAYPHSINKVWEVVEPETSPITQLFWALGLIPIPVSDHWSFVLDVLFCGVTLAGLRYHDASSMPFWKIDKYIRQLLGPNPFRAHDAIGAAGANFLTWSCLHHLHQEYGELFAPTSTLCERKDSGQNWYPPNHFRPMVNWPLTAEEKDNFDLWLLGPLFQMTTLLLQEKRAPLAHINSISELCAQFQPGILATLRKYGTERIVQTVQRYHLLHPQAAQQAWFPEALSVLESVEGQQLYVNAEHNGKVGIITISRESYNHDVDRELNRAIDWLRWENIGAVIVTGDFHLSTQMVGADTNEFFPALQQKEKGLDISQRWSETARRLYQDFEISVGFVQGKRCLGGYLELLSHCHYLVAHNDAQLGMPEVTLPVVPGMEGCHWLFRRSTPKQWPMLMRFLLEGHTVPASEATGWLIDYAAPLEASIAQVWKLVTATTNLSKRPLLDGILEPPTDLSFLPETDNALLHAGRKAIFDCIQDACRVPLHDALLVQAKHSSHFMVTSSCMNGAIGKAQQKINL